MLNQRINNLMKNSLVFILGNFASKILIFFLLPLYTNVLDPNEYGEMDIYINILAILFSVVSLQAGESVFRFIVDAKTEEEKTSVISNALVSAVVGILSFALGMTVFGAITGFKYTFIFILYVTFNILSVFCQQTIRGLNLSFLYSSVGVLATLVQLTGNIVFIVIFKMGAVSLLWAYIITFVFTFLFISLKCRFYKYIKLSAIKPSIIKEHLKFNLPLLPNALCLWGVSSLGKYLLLFFYSTASVGLYAFATKFSQLIAAINGVIFFAWQQSAISEYNSEDKDEYATEIFNKFIALELGAISVIIPIVKFLVFTVMGEEYRMAWVFIPIFFIGALFQFCGDFVSIGFFGAKKTNTVFYASMASLLIYFATGVFGVKYWHIAGAGLSYSVSKLAYYIILQIRVKKYLYAKPLVKKLIVPTVMSLASAALYYSIDSFILLIFASLVFAGLTVFINRDVIKEIISMILGRLSKKKN